MSQQKSGQNQMLLLVAKSFCESLGWGSWSPALSASVFFRGFRVPVAEGLFSRFIQVVAPFQTLNSYGLFAVMTTTRPEIVVEGSTDGKSWKSVRVSLETGRSVACPAVELPTSASARLADVVCCAGKSPAESMVHSICG